MDSRKLTIVVVLGLAVGFAALYNAIVVTGALFLSGLLVGMIAAGTSERPIRNMLRAMGWGGLVLVVASALLGLAELAGHYGTWAWPTPPENAVLVVWVGGSLMMLFWLALGSLIRVLKQ